MSQVQREPYTADDKAKVAELMRAGLSASQIGEQVGRSRNSVISFVHRHKDLGEIGLHGAPAPGGRRDMSIKASRKQGGIKGGKPAKINPQNIVAKKVSRRSDPVLVDQAVPAPDARMVSLMELKSGDCRFPVEGSGVDARFCAAPIRPGHSYCNHHRQIACVGLWRAAA